MARMLPLLWFLFISWDLTVADWSLVLEDDFDGTSLDSSIWNIRHNASHCCPQEPQLYVEDNVQVSGGALTIATRYAPTVGPDGAIWNYTSGWVDTKGLFDQETGRWEVVAQLPSATCTGAWPAYWLLPSNDSVCWPVGGEIDIMEAAMNEVYNPVATSYRWGTECGKDLHPLPGATFPAPRADPIDWAADFHEFAVEWTEDSVTFSVDGVDTYSVGADDRLGLPKTPMYLILDTALAWGVFMPWGAADRAVLPCTHVIGSVRVYEWI